jgi:translocation and assembly module TamB
MTGSDNRSPDPVPERPNWRQRLVHRLKHPSKGLVIGTTVTLAVGVGAYLGTQYLVRYRLPPFVEAQLSQIINQPVELGRVESFSLTGITFGPSFIRPTDTAPNKAAVDQIRVGFNILPVIFRRTLPLDITLVQPDAYLQQQADGTWLNLDLPEPPDEPLIYLDLTANIEQGQITAVPYNQSPIQVGINGSARYNPVEEELVQYDLDVTIAQAQVILRGYTRLDTGQTNTKLLVEDLSLAEVVALIPNLPINLSSGLLNADLDINIPSFEEIAAANIEGFVNLQGVEGEATDLKAPITGRSRLDFEGDDARVQDTQVTLADIVAQIQGTLNWRQGYNLSINVLPFSLTSIEQIAPGNLPVDLAGQMQAQMQLIGAIREPVLTGKINNTQTITLAQTQFKQVTADFTADLNQVVLESFQATPLAGGSITGKGIIETKIGASLADEEGTIDANTMPLSFDFQAQLPTKQILAPYYSLPEQISVGTLSAQGNAGGTLGQPDARLQWQIPQATTAGVENVSGRGTLLLEQQNILVRDTLLNIGQGTLNVEGNANLEQQTWQSGIAANRVPLTPFIAQLVPDQITIDRPITLQTGNIALSGVLDADALNRIKGRANLGLNVDGSDVSVRSTLDAGIIDATATTGAIAVNNFVPDLTIPTTIQSSRLALSGQIQQLLTLGEDPNLSSFRGNVDANLLVAEGTARVSGNLLNNQWQANATANNLNTSLLVTELLPEREQPLDLDPLNAQVNLTGNLNPLLRTEEFLPIGVNNFSAQLREQELDATGNLVLRNLTTNPDIANVNLDLNASIDFDRLPIDQLLAQTTADNQLLAETVALAGQADFQGRLDGRNLLSAPLAPGNLALVGDLRLDNFAFNDVVFEPVLTGNLNLVSGDQLAINLRGNRDVIFAAAEPCTEERCRFPYLPTGVELRQGEGTANPVLAIGERQEDLFSLNILNFPLALLNLAPGQPLGIEGPLAGDVTGEIDLNLFTLATVGQIQVAQPAIGYIEADRFQAEFAYDDDANLAQVMTASLELGESLYNFVGSVNLASGQLDGRLNIPEAYIQDLLTAFRWFELEDLFRLFQTPEYAEAAAVRPEQVDAVDESIAQKLRLLQVIEGQIQAIAAEKQAGGLPTDLDIRGGYTGEVLLAGTILAPEIGFDVQGSNWQWQPQRAFPNIVEPLGFITEQIQAIPIDQLVVRGTFEDGVANLATTTVQVGDALFSLEGQLSPQQQNANFQVTNLSLDRVDNFVNIPVDVSGTIDASGKLQGSLTEPQIEGDIVLANAAFGGRALLDTIVGNFNYANEQLQLNTTAPESLQIEASIPFPIEPQTNDVFILNAQLGTQAIGLLGAVTQENLIWLGGEGEAQLQARGRIDLTKDFILQDLTAFGEVNLQDAVVQITPLGESLNVSGRAFLRNRLLDVENIMGTFANSGLTATGALPLLQTVANIDNPLTVNIPEGEEIAIEGLYAGGIDGEVVVTGTALNPVINGRVNLVDGNAFIPEGDNEQATPTVLNGQPQEAPPPPPILARLNNLQVNLENFRVQQQPLYDIAVEGDLILNGVYDTLASIEPKGTLLLTRADVDLLASNFFLARDRENTVVFTPQDGLFNPYLDIQLNTDVSELTTLRLLESGENEISDPISQVGQTDIINITLSIDGEAQAILPGLGQLAPATCRIDPESEVIEDTVSYTQTELNQFANCINVATLEQERDLQILTSPAVELTSIPARSQAEIISLLGEEFLALAEQLQGSNAEELLEFGVAQFVIAPLQRRLFRQVDDFVVGVGRGIGLDYLRVYPFLEGVYQIDRNSSVRTTYDYIFNEVQIRYQRNF